MLSSSTAKCNRPRIEERLKEGIAGMNNGKY